MISDYFSLQDILLSFENTLRIEYEENNCDKLIASAKTKLENAYQVKLDRPVYDVQAQNALVSDSLNVFLEQLSQPVRDLAACTSMVMFSKINVINLADVNYLGFAAEMLRTSLKYLQDRSHYETRGFIIPALRNAVSNIEMSQVKRLFVIMLVLEELGIKEAVAVVAQHLYIGGLNL